MSSAPTTDRPSSSTLWPADVMTPSGSVSSFLYLVDALQDHARRGDLPHFFVPECNLFSPTIFHRRALAFLVRALDEQKREGLPLLKPPALVSLLKPSTAAAHIILEKPTEKSSLPTASCLKLTLLFFLVVLFAFCCFWD